MYKPYLIRPLQNGLDLSIPSLHQQFSHMAWPSQNVKIEQHSVQKRAGYADDRDFGAGVDIQRVVFFRTSTGGEYTVILTDGDACERESTGTWSYITEVYTTGSISSVSGATVTGSSTGWDTGSGNPAAGDYFILDDDLGASSEPDVDWAEILSVDSDTSITLSGSYLGANTSGDYTIRKVYTVPNYERWNVCSVADKLIACNGNVNTQYWDGTDEFSELNATYATKARHCIEYADRLVLADYYMETGVRNALGLRLSKNGDPTQFYAEHSSAVDYDLRDTESPIMGLGKVGSDLVILKSDSILMANQTGQSTDPLQISKERVGIGCPASFSITQVMGTVAFVGRDDFYVIDGGIPVPIPGSEYIRYKFFDLVNPTEIQRVFGYTNTLQNEARWFATGTDNVQRCYVWNYKSNQWYVYRYHHDMSCGGAGEI